MKTKEIFQAGLQFHHYANTAYPLTPNSFRQFQLRDAGTFSEFLRADWARADQVNLYVHIPFCQTRCRFCEYTVLENTTPADEDEYVDLLLKEIALYAPLLRGKQVIGYDMGGGTPTFLSLANLKKITAALETSFSFAADVVYSIETTPVIAAREPEKIKALFDLGYRRISMGVQTVSESLLNALGREGSTHIYERAAQNIRAAGYGSFNIDLMYGFLHQQDSELETTLKYAISLNPDHITLYRNRYKGTQLEDEAGGVSLYRIMSQYRLAYRTLKDAGYQGNIGKNTFSRIPGDYGTSDYLTHRVIEGVPYLGLGLGAQSFGTSYLAYNHGAASKAITAYRKVLTQGQLPLQDIYALPEDEAMAKMVSVAFYFGFVDEQAFQHRFGVAFRDQFTDAVTYLLAEGLMEAKEQRLYLTERGADYINGIIPLFYSKRSQREMLELMNSKGDTRSHDEQAFLKVYNLNNYQRPSLAVDAVIFHEPQAGRVQLLLIKRGAHPFMNDWALPGGFVQPDESAEQAVRRELSEEAGLVVTELKQLPLYSEAGRDPRGWIVSAPFWGTSDDSKVTFGDDAIEACWFTVQLESTEDDCLLRLSADNYELRAVCATQEPFTVKESQGIAFDHASMIIRALVASSY